MQKYLSVITLAAAAFGCSDALACTSLIATAGATASGSSMITYAADSHTLYGALYHQDAADHPAGAVRRVVDWDSNRYLGDIAEAAHPHAPGGNMNEPGGAIAGKTGRGGEGKEGRSRGAPYT